MATGRLSVADLDARRAEGKTVVGANRVVRNDAKKRLERTQTDKYLRQVFDRVRKYGRVTDNTSDTELAFLVFEHESHTIKEQAFNMLAARRQVKTAGEQLGRIARSESGYAARAQDLLGGS